ncbi:hypothetical protein ACHAWF_011160 [Thalassiosira exigua]
MSDASSVSVPTKATATAAAQPTTDWRTIVRDTFSALFDMVGDWAYLYAIFHRDVDGDGTPDVSDWKALYEGGVSLDYNTLVHAVLAFCILSTIFTLWTTMTSLGRRCGRETLCGTGICETCTVPRLALISIFVEDVPQFVLTTYIDFTFAGGLTPAGMMNICSSLTSLVNRSTSRYDQILEEDEDGAGENGKSELGTTYKAMA